MIPHILFSVNMRGFLFYGHYLGVSRQQISGFRVAFSCLAVLPLYPQLFFDLTIPV